MSMKRPLKVREGNPYNST